MGRKLFEKARYVIDQITSRGVTVNPSSRFGRMHRLMCDDTGGPGKVVEPNDEDFETALEALRDLNQMEFVFDVLAERPDLFEHEGRLKKVLDDAVVPKADDEATIGRNAQTELFVSAVCERAGLAPEGAEPDLVCSVKNHQVAVAVKRVRSLDNFEKEIRKAGKQMEASGHDGVVVVDSTILFNRSNERITAVIPAAVFEQNHRAFFNRFLDEYGSRIEEWVRRRRVLGMIFHDHQVRFDPEFGRCLSTLHFGVGLEGFAPHPNDGRMARYSAFSDQYLKHGTPGSPRS